METHAEGVDFMAKGRRRILDVLEESPGTPVAELPRQWPLTRLHLRVLVEELEAEGEVVRAGGPGGGRVWRSGDEGGGAGKGDGRRAA